MRNTALIVAVALVAAAIGGAWASAPLKATMRDWKAGLGTLDEMTAPGGGFDSPQISRIVNQLSDDAGRLASRLSTSNAQAQDVKRRFEALAADAQSLAAASHRDAARVKYNALHAGCVSCHDAYAH